MDPDLISVPAAAERLGVSPDAVRKSIAAGRLTAWKRGRQWWVDARSVDRIGRQRGSGRPMSPDMAWGVLLLASGDEDAARRALRNPRYASRARNWLTTHSLADQYGRLRDRARLEHFEAHPSEIERILGRDDVLVTGISAGDVVGLVGGDPAAELYAPAGRRSVIIREHGLESGSGPVRIRWVDDSVWSLLDGDGDGRAPVAAILVDLLEHDDPRARRDAGKALSR